MRTAQQHWQPTARRFVGANALTGKAKTAKRTGAQADPTPARSLQWPATQVAGYGLGGLQELLFARLTAESTQTSLLMKWINSKCAKLSVFVSNRIGKIRREIAVNQWHHVPGIHNPADLCSRGIEPTDGDAAIAFHRGPDYLQLDRRARSPNDF